MSAHSLFIFSHDPEIMIKESSTIEDTEGYILLKTHSRDVRETEHTDTDLSVTKTMSIPMHLSRIICLRSMEKLKILPRCHKTKERLLSKIYRLKESKTIK